MSTSTSHTNSEITLTYKYLLTFSTLSAVFFCWLYVTKPTIVSAIPSGSIDSAEQEPDSAVSQSTTPSAPEKNSFAKLSSGGLPGDTPANSELSQTSAAEKGSNIPLPKSQSTEGLVDFEETNHRIQHVITAQSNALSERIIIQVPVIYKTRGLRFGPEQANEAQRVLRALKIYQSQINKLHQDGKNIQLAWDSLLMSAQPVAALRADSPSLPQKSSSHPSMLSENSASTIKLSE